MWGWVTNEKIPFPICLCLGWSQVIKQWELPVADQPSTSPQRWCAGAFLHPNEPLQELREKWGLWWGTATAMTQIRGLGGWGMWFSFCWDWGGECCGQGVHCRLAADSPGTSARKKDPLRRHGRIHTVVSEYLRKNHGARECKYWLISFSTFFWWFYRGAPLQCDHCCLESSMEISKLFVRD